MAAEAWKGYPWEIREQANARDMERFVALQNARAQAAPPDDGLQVGQRVTVGNTTRTRLF